MTTCPARPCCLPSSTTLFWPPSSRSPPAFTDDGASTFGMTSRASVTPSIRERAGSRVTLSCQPCSAWPSIVRWSRCRATCRVARLSSPFSTMSTPSHRRKGQRWFSTASKLPSIGMQASRCTRARHACGTRLAKSLPTSHVCNPSSLSVSGSAIGPCPHRSKA